MGVDRTGRSPVPRLGRSAGSTGSATAGWFVTRLRVGPSAGGQPAGAPGTGAADQNFEAMLDTA